MARYATSCAPLMKRCTPCQQLKPIGEFQQNPRYAGGHENRCRDCKKAENAEHRKRVRREVFDHYGWACRCCGSLDNPTIDHMAGNGREHRGELFASDRQAGWPFYYWLRRNGFPLGFQTLCSRCNSSKHRTGVCRFHGVTLAA